jgi:ssDNA-binding Zn-finger/Zn-ribbon topoisomerase 1
VRLHPLEPSVKCQHCGKGDLVFVRTWKSRDLYRCVAATPCESYTVHSRHDGRVCGVGAEVGTGPG